MKVGVVGSGLVGSTAAYALVMRGVARGFLLVVRTGVAAEVDDIRHTVPFAHALEVRSSSYEDLDGYRAVVLCARVGQKPGSLPVSIYSAGTARWCPRY